MSRSAVTLPDLPPSWCWANLSEVCLKIQDGTHFSPKQQSQGAFRYLTAKNVRQWGLSLSNVTYVDEDTHRVIYARCDPKPGDVLLVKDGVNTGDAAINTLHEEFSLLSSVCLLRPDRVCLSPQFLRYFLLSPIGSRLLTGRMSGTAIRRIVLEQIRQTPVAIAPIAEQDRIVAEIEKQFTRLDAAVAALKRVQANLKRYRAAVLKAAVEGRLVPTEADLSRQEGRVLEGANDLLRRLLPGGPAADARVVPRWSVPDGWTWATVGQVGQVQLGRQRSPEHHDGPNMRPYLRAANVTWRGLDLSDVKRMNFEAADLERHRLQPGDILLAEASGSASEVGRPALWSGQIDECCCQNTLIRIRPYLTDPRYLFWHLYHDALRGEFGEAARGVGIHHLGAAGLEAWRVAIPPLPEQVRIVAELDSVWSVLDALEQSMAFAVKKTTILRSSVLEAAFRGGLVSRGLDDEPANMLPGGMSAARPAVIPDRKTVPRRPRRPHPTSSMESS